MRPSPTNPGSGIPHTPAVTVVIPADSGAPGPHGHAPCDLARAIHALRAQTVTDWYAVVVGEPCTAEILRLTRDDPRFEFLPGAPRPHESINIGLDHARGTWVTILDPRDYLAPHCFDSLLAAATHHRTPAAFGSFAFTSPLGVMPGDPIAGIPPRLIPQTIGHEELLSAKLFPLHAQLVRRDALADIRLRAPIELGGDHDLLLRIAERGSAGEPGGGEEGGGTRWAFCGHRVATVQIDPPQPHRAIITAVAAHARTIDLALARTLDSSSPESATRRAALLAPHADALLLMQAFLQTLSDAASSAHPQTALAGLLHPPHLFAQWWQRLRFCGRPPLHALEACGGADLSALASPAMIAQRLVKSCDQSRPIVLLGLGPNARNVAAILQERGHRVIGRDQRLTSPPPWATHDKIDLRLEPFTAPWQKDTQYLVTSLDDQRLIDQLPAGLKLHRWSRTRAQIVADLRADAISLLDGAFHEPRGQRTPAPALQSARGGRPMKPAPSAHDNRPALDIFLASFKRPDKLAAMIESVRDSRYPARILVAAGDPGTIQTCERYPGLVECIYSTRANTRTGCTAPLNLVFRNLVQHDALFCTDDCIFEPDCFDIAMATLHERFPDTDGVIGLAQDNITGGYDLAFPLFGMKFLDRFRNLPPEFTRGIGHGHGGGGGGGDLFWPGYFHLFNDAEIGLTIKCMGNWAFEPRARLRHFHPEHGGGEMDLTHNHGLTFKREDAIAWTDRRAAGKLWGLDA